MWSLPPWSLEAASITESEGLAKHVSKNKEIVGFFNLKFFTNITSNDMTLMVRQLPDSLRFGFKC